MSLVPQGNPQSDPEACLRLQISSIYCAHRSLVFTTSCLLDTFHRWLGLRFRVVPPYLGILIDSHLEGPLLHIFEVQHPLRLSSLLQYLWVILVSWLDHQCCLMQRSPVCSHFEALIQPLFNVDLELPVSI